MEKHVQVRSAEGDLLFTYTINLRGLNYEPSDDEFIAEAKRMAAEDQLATPALLPLLRPGGGSECARSASPISMRCIEQWPRP